jgi:hypothetical protein
MGQADPARREAPGFFGFVLDGRALKLQKKQGATGHCRSRALHRRSVGQGDNRLPRSLRDPKFVPAAAIFFVHA